MMFTQTTVYVLILILLEISNSYSFERYMEHKCSASDQCTLRKNNYCDKSPNPDNSKLINYDKQDFIYYDMSHPINLPSLPIMFAQSKHLQNEQCNEAARLFLNGLENGTLWAMQMYDASSKYPDGILYGNTRHLGNFDECYNLHVNIRREQNGDSEITGRYCLVDLHYKRRNTSLSSDKSVVSEVDPESSFWDVIEEHRNGFRFGHLRRYFLQLALCIPSTCSPTDVETILKDSVKEYNKNNNIEIQITISNQFCQVATEKFMSTPAIIYCIFLATLVALTIVVTWCDVEEDDNESCKSTFRTALLCFSARRNIKSMFQITYSNPGIDSIHLSRFIMTLIVISGHYTFRYYANPFINFIHFEEFLDIPISILYLNGTLIIDVFFAISAILITYYLLKDLNQGKQDNIINNIIYRYIRFTPSYMAVIFFHIWILPLLGSGPFWKDEIEQESARCAANWWTNLLYINNYVQSTQICMFQSWYMSAIFQLFIVNHFVIYAFWRMSRKFGYFFLGMLMIAACFIPFAAAYFYNVIPSLIFMPYKSNFRDVPYFQHYMKTHTHASAYFVGMITGAILYDQQQIKWQMSKFLSHILVMPLPVTLIFTFQLWSYKLFVPYGDWSINKIALYAFWHSLIPAVCICMITAVLSVGSGIEIYQKLATPRWIQPITILTYGVYLINDTLNSYHMGQARSANMVSSFGLIREAIPHLIISFTMSLFLAICIEMPFRKLSKQYISWKIHNVNKKYL